MSEFKSVFRIWTLLTGAFIALSAILVTSIVVYRTVEFERSTKGAYQKLLESHLSKEYASIGEEIYLNLDSLDARKKQLQALLGNSASVEMNFQRFTNTNHSKPIDFRPETSMHWQVQENVDHSTLSLPIYFADLLLGQLSVGVRWRGDWTDAGKRSIWLAITAVIALLMVSWFALFPILRARVFNPLLEKILKLQRAAAASQIARRWAHDFDSTLAVLEEVLPPIESLPSENREAIRVALSQMRNASDKLLKVGRDGLTIEDTEVFAHGCARSDVAAVVQSTLASKRILAKKQNIYFKFDGNDETKNARAPIDETELAMTLSNILDNSIEAMNQIKPGEIALELRIESDHLRLSVTDNGVGIPAHILSRLAREELTYGKAGGSGLGLFNARKTMESIGGDLKITSNEGKGTSVTLEFPMIKVQSLDLPPDLILIDDQRSVHLAWQIGAKIYKKNLAVFENGQDFLAANISKSTPVYVDYYLGRWSGEEVAQQLFDLGYQSLHLTTALRDQISKPDFVLSVCGKGFPLSHGEDVATAEPISEKSSRAFDSTLPS